MTLRTSLLRQLENASLSLNSRAELCCEVAKEFEDKGEYEDAREALCDFWKRIGERPSLESLEQSTAAELLLRAGVLTGAIGSKHQLVDAQEKAKDLISESLTIFESHRYKKEDK